MHSRGRDDCVAAVEYGLLLALIAEVSACTGDVHRQACAAHHRGDRLQRFPVRGSADAARRRARRLGHRALRER
jgi:hypothetical protein